MSYKNKKGSKLAGNDGVSKLTKEEITVFISNAQTVLAASMDEERIPALYVLKEELKKLLEPGRKFTKEEWATVLVSVAWDLYVE